MHTSHCQLEVFQSLIVPSSDPEASLPAQSIAALTASEWSSNERTRLQVSVFHTFSDKHGKCTRRNTDPPEQSAKEQKRQVRRNGNLNENCRRGAVVGTLFCDGSSTHCDDSSTQRKGMEMESIRATLGSQGMQSGRKRVPVVLEVNLVDPKNPHVSGVRPHMTGANTHRTDRH